MAVIPHITPFEFEGEINNADSVQLTCYVSKGDTPINITWYLNEKPIGTHLGITMMSIGARTNLLSINSVDREHAGIYTCKASNRGGHSSHSAYLLINGTKFFFHFHFVISPSAHPSF